MQAGESTTIIRAVNEYMYGRRRERRGRNLTTTSQMGAETPKAMTNQRVSERLIPLWTSSTSRR